MLSAAGHRSHQRVWERTTGTEWDGVASLDVMSVAAYASSRFVELRAYTPGDRNLRRWAMPECAIANTQDFSPKAFVPCDEKHWPRAGCASPQLRFARLGTRRRVRGTGFPETVTWVLAVRRPRMEQDDFTAFEHGGWERAVQPYRDYFERLTTQSNAPLLDTLGVGEGTRFLDVATGPGFLAAAAASRGAVVTGVDFSAAMIAQARRQYPDIDFHEGSAEDLPFEDGAFDAVGIGFGMLHFSHPDKALSEAFRVIHHGGKIAFTVWAVPEKAVGFQIVLRAIEAHGKMDVPIPPGPPFFRFSEAEESSRALRNAGFSDPKV